MLPEGLELIYVDVAQREQKRQARILRLELMRAAIASLRAPVRTDRVELTSMPPASDDLSSDEARKGLVVESDG